MKEEGKESETICRSGDAGVKYRHGVALVSSFSRDIWLPLWVPGGRISLNCGAKI